MKEEIYGQIQSIEQTHWWYVARRKIIFDWVLRILANYTIPHVLDIGCGTGFNMEYLRAHGCDHVIGLDFSTESLTFCQSRNRGHLVCGDGTRPPLQQGSFDVIMALDLIEHLDDDLQAMWEFARLLKSEGSLIIFTPAFDFLWGLQDEVGYHRRRYTANELRQKLEKVGLCISKLSYVNTFLFPLIFAGRITLRVFGNSAQVISENNLHPGWSNGLLQAIFAAERSLLHFVNFPFGVSLLCIAHRETI